MTTTQLNRLIRLLKKTGEKTMVLDQASDEILVLMPFEAYEDLLAEAECGPNDDPYDDAVDPNFFSEPSHPVFSDQDDDSMANEFESAQGTEREIMKSEPPSVASSEKETKRSLDFSDSWSKHNSPILPEESLTDVPHDEEEEKFYLEPVE